MIFRNDKADHNRPYDLLLCGAFSRAEQLPKGISNEFYWPP